MTTTMTAAAVVRSAMDEARELRSAVLGQEHVLLALGSAPDSIGGRTFAACGIDPAFMRTTLLTMITRGPDGTGDPTPTSRLHLALREAEAEASEHGRPTTSADLVLGILRSHQGVGFQLLGYSGVKEDAMRSALESVLDGHPELDDVDETSVTAIFG